jgi:hypothetical protein
MRIRSAIAVAVVVAGLSASAAVYAAPANIDAHAHAMFAKSKIVKLTLRNDSGSAMELKVGDKVMTLDAGKTVALKLPLGTRIMANAATAKHQAGELLAEVSTNLDDTTVVIK